LGGRKYRFAIFFSNVHSGCFCRHLVKIVSIIDVVVIVVVVVVVIVVVVVVVVVVVIIVIVVIVVVVAVVVDDVLIEATGEYLLLKYNLSKALLPFPFTLNKLFILQSL